MEPLQWIFVVTALTLVFVVFAINPLQVAIEEAVQNNAQLQTQRLASVINMMRSAPSGTSYTFSMTNTKCRVNITDNFVKLTIIPSAGLEVPYTVSTINTGTPIQNINFDCKRTVQFRNTGSRLDVIPSP
ncbi:MAG TPA: hypothetical protein VJB05_00280 [archaeon]|nr:hypothetical protein [archaeon]